MDTDSTNCDDLEITIIKNILSRNNFFDKIKIIQIVQLKLIESIYEFMKFWKKAKFLFSYANLYNRLNHNHRKFKVFRVTSLEIIELF